jgi:hypothetical protein
MRKILFFITLFLWNCSGGGGSSPTETDDGNGDNVFVHNDIVGYEVVFFDYFNSPLDMTKWNDSPWWGREHSGNGSVMYYAPVTDKEGPRVEGCCLKIPVDRLPDQSVLPVPYNDPNSWPGILDYTSGSINTHMKFNFTYGIVKFRAKAAKEKGIWPAVWMIVPRKYTVQNDTWGPEIDILEMSHLHNTSPNVMGGYLYWTDKEDSSPGFHIAESDFPLFDNYTDDFHEYELHWSEDEIVFYFDGHEIIRVTRDSFDGMGDPPHSDWIADVPMYLMINVAVGASWMELDAMPDENTQFPIDDALMVDYIKVYQKID